MRSEGGSGEQKRSTHCRTRSRPVKGFRLQVQTPERLEHRRHAEIPALIPDMETLRHRLELPRWPTTPRAFPERVREKVGAGDILGGSVVITHAYEHGAESTQSSLSKLFESLEVSTLGSQDERAGGDKEPGVRGGC